MVDGDSIQPPSRNKRKADELDDVRSKWYRNMSSLQSVFDRICETYGEDSILQERVEVLQANATTLRNTNAQLK
eukprot:442453-Hanusia_phi.AAC.1